LVEGAFVSEGIHRDAVADEAFAESSVAAQHAGTFLYFSYGGRWLWSQAFSAAHALRGWRPDGLGALVTLPRKVKHVATLQAAIEHLDQ
jgi:hypothetical protein